MHAVAGSKKTDLLRQLEGACSEAGLTLRLHTKPKKDDGAQQIQDVLAVLKASADDPMIGTLPKVRQSRV
jgi:hypothetical protein